MADIKKPNRIRIYAAVAVAALTLVVVAQNTETVEVHILFWTVSASRALLLFLMLIAGFICGLVLATRQRKKA